jgi:chorismate dehydratase
MKKITLGTVPFLNSKPLIYPLEKGIIEHNLKISYFIPSQLTEKLNSTEVDIALIPVAELFKNPEYKIFPDICISSFGPVDSVVLLAKKNIDELSSVSIDKRSRSSTALVKIILEKFHLLNPDYHYREIDEGFLANVDSGMLIGNAGLHAKHYPPRGFSVYDLGQIWTAKTGLPFVYAVFAYRADNEDAINTIKSILLESKSLGIKNIDQIIKEDSAKLGLSTEICCNYLTKRIRYDLGTKEIEGIKKFGGYLMEYDIDIGNTGHAKLFKNLILDQIN